MCHLAEATVNPDCILCLPVHKDYGKKERKEKAKALSFTELGGRVGANPSNTLLFLLSLHISRECVPTNVFVHFYLALIYVASKAQKH